MARGPKGVGREIRTFHILPRTPAEVVLRARILIAAAPAHHCASELLESSGCGSVATQGGSPFQSASIMGALEDGFGKTQAAFTELNSVAVTGPANATA